MWSAFFDMLLFILTLFYIWINVHQFDIKVSKTMFYTKMKLESLLINYLWLFLFLRNIFSVILFC